MARSHTVTLKLGREGLAVTAWDEITLTLDLLNPGNPWTVTLWRSRNGAAWVRVREAAELLAPVTVEIDGAVQLCGVLERIKDGAGRAGAPLTLSGRDLLAGALVADVDPRLQMRDATLEEVIERALAPLQIPVTVGVSADEVRHIQAGARPGTRAGSGGRTRRRQHIDRFKPRPGQRVWQFLAELARRHGYLLYAGPWGGGVGLVIDRPAYDAAPVGTLTRQRQRDGTWRGNLLDGTLDLNATDVPTEVTVYGHTRLSAPQDARHRATLANDWMRTAERVAATFAPRPRYVRDPRARTPKIAAQRARHVIHRAMADFAVYEATVQGFAFGSPARLWTINSMVTLADELTGARGNWLVTRVGFSRSRQGGHTTHLRLVPPGSIDLEPDSEV